VNVKCRKAKRLSLKTLTWLIGFEMNVKSCVNVNLDFVSFGLEGETCWVESILKLLNAVMMMA